MSRHYLCRYVLTIFQWLLCMRKLKRHALLGMEVNALGARIYRIGFMRLHNVQPVNAPQPDASSSIPLDFFRPTFSFSACSRSSVTRIASSTCRSFMLSMRVSSCGGICARVEKSSSRIRSSSHSHSWFSSRRHSCSYAAKRSGEERPEKASGSVADGTARNDCLIHSIVTMASNVPKIPTGVKRGPITSPTGPSADDTGPNRPPP